MNVKNKRELLIHRYCFKGPKWSAMKRSTEVLKFEKIDSINHRLLRTNQVLTISKCMGMWLKVYLLVHVVL